jgi:hypothetical protein
MSDQRQIPPEDVSPEGISHTRKIPPLVWVILALLVLVLGIGAVGGFSQNHTEDAKPTAVAT